MADSDEKKRRKQNCTISLIILALVLMIIGVGLLAPGPWNWIGILVLMAGIMWAIGSNVSSSPFGVLITQRNLISLARFQAVAWTLLILSAYVTMVLIRVRAGVENPLVVGIDKYLWALMGISTTSLVGTSLVVGSKRDMEPTTQAVDLAADKLKEPKTEIEQHRQGTLYANPTPGDAQLTDMFQGDEVGDTAHVDLGKVQMFFFTVLVVVVYGVMVFTQFAGASSSDLNQLPVLHESIIALLGISHAGYLTKAGLSQTQTK